MYLYFVRNRMQNTRIKFGRKRVYPAEGSKWVSFLAAEATLLCTLLTRLNIIRTQTAITTERRIKTQQRNSAASIMI
jgi:hypothetical protein